MKPVMTVIGFELPELGAEGDADRQRRVDGQDVVPEEDLDEHGRPAEEPRVGPRRAGQQRVRRQAHRGDEQPADDAHEHRDGRQPERHLRTRDVGRGEDHLAHLVPAEAPLHPRGRLRGDLRQQRVDQHGHDDAERRRVDPPARVSHRDGLDGAVRVDSCGATDVLTACSSPSGGGSEREVVDLGGLDRPRLHAPVLEDRGVDAVLDEDVHRREDRLVERRLLRTSRSRTARR